MSGEIQSLTDLLDRVSARRFLAAQPPEDLGLAEHLPFPFLALVGQEEMKLALLLAVINPLVGGVLLIGPRGTGKTTAIRGLADLLPDVSRSLCPYGCVPEDITSGGMDAVCPDCARRYGEGEPLTFEDRVRLIELPLNAEMEDVVGGFDPRAAVHKRLRLKRGILGLADQNLLFVDEVNLLRDEILDAILDAAAQGIYTMHRGPLNATYRARFLLAGSMNPEEGHLRPQIMDRFGLRVVVRGLADPKERLEAYKRAVFFKANPRAVGAQFKQATEQARQEVAAARQGLQDVELSPEAETFGLDLIQTIGIHTLRAEITLFEGAKAYAVADGRSKVTEQDVRAVAPMALRLRRSAFMRKYAEEMQEEDHHLHKSMEKIRSRPSKKAQHAS